MGRIYHSKSFYIILIYTNLDKEDFSVISKVALLFMFLKFLKDIKTTVAQPLAYENLNVLTVKYILKITCL